MKTTIIVHCLIKNEEKFIWYALNSVLPYVDKILVWDTGSTDDTIKIIETINSPKIELKELESVSAQSHTLARQKMLDKTPKNYDWLMILDGDEVWPKDQLKKTLNYISNNKNKSAIVVRTKNFVGDIYHCLPESAGQYQIGNIKGHLNLRFINLKQKNLKVINPHGGQTYVANDTPLQELPSSQLAVLDTYYYHATHLQRSSEDKQTLKRTFKFKYELGNPLKQEKLPEIFFTNRPSVVPKVTGQMSKLFFLNSFIQTPIKRLKRLIIKPKSGY